MYYDRTCGTLVTRCAWLERSRVSFSSSRRCAFAFSRLRFQGVRHDPVSESLRVLRRGLARRFMTRHHRLSRRRTPPRSRLHLRFESNSRATAVAPNVPRTVPQRAIGRARDRDARSGRRSIGGGPSGGGDRRSGLRRSGVRIVRRSGLRRSGVRIVRRSGLRRSGVRIRAAAPLEHPRTSAVSIEWATGRDTFPSRLCWRPRVPARASAPTPDERRADASRRANGGRPPRARIRRDVDAATRATSAPDSSNSTRTAPRRSLARVRGSYYERATRRWTSPRAGVRIPTSREAPGRTPVARFRLFFFARRTPVDREAA